MRRYIIITLFALFICSSQVLGHSGRTDSNGGHYNRTTGVYHYHNGGGGSQNLNHQESGDIGMGWVIISGGFFVFMLILAFLSEKKIPPINGYTIHKMVYGTGYGSQYYRRKNNNYIMYDVRRKDVTVAQFTTKESAEHYAKTH